MKRKVINFEQEYDELLHENPSVILEPPDEVFKNFYYMYEYTDDIDVIKDDPLYPSMLNYVKTGLLTKAEMIEAITFKTNQRLD